MKMLPGSLLALVSLVTVLNLSPVTGALLSDKDSCGCHKVCDEKFASKDKPELKLRYACRSGCRFFHLIFRVPHKIAPPEAVRMAEENCANSCTLSQAGGPSQDACITGCQNGCEFVVSVQPRVKLTILVEDEINSPDAAELEQVLTDPALRQQLESHLASEKTKIPASYFTKLPVVREGGRGCGPEPHLCEGWLAGEPLLCASLLVLVVALMLTIYRRRSVPEPTDSAPLLPEKPPLQLSV